MPAKKVSIGKKPGNQEKPIGIEEWVANREDSWFEENGIFIGSLGYAEIKLYGTGLQFSKQPKVVD